ncbi:heavy metal translocating P-type ATPase [Intestinimonas butyriciproducens]|uniref:heavy metal translocating P-type ATPase n=1 Tax=Intestinimonas butyriciproducens TaxID=1297617 RepID=UPI00195E561F|nr:heavy metal translocating P-type ATPase [Intestinimonas butyriciproducens]MBM6977367.1 cadmium-translocating P-type ATPase [Intestinimonas butyriciproducens]
MTKKQKQTLWRIVASAALLVWAALGPTLWLPGNVPFLSVGRVAEDGTAAFFLAPWVRFLIPYLVIGWDVLWRAVRNIAHGQIFDENFLMAIATVGALCIGEYAESVFVMLFYQVGELFQSYAVGRSRQSIAELMEIRPDYANVERDGTVEQVDPDEVEVGETIVIKAGERVPLDGVVLEGRSDLDTAALTGESLPREVQSGDDVISGCVNLTGLLKVRVTRAFEESTVSKILDLVENAGSKKAKAENFITKFARYYTPTVVLAAVALALLPPLVGAVGWSESLHRALIFLVISCPCALVISVPLSFFGGIGGASKAGVLVKGGAYLEVLARAQIVVFDKTGTLTKGVFNVTAVHPEQCGEDRLLELAALAESWSEHPISRSLREAYGKEVDASRVTDVEEHSGRGVHAKVDGQEIWVGNDKLMDSIGVSWHPCHRVGTTVHVAAKGEYLGHIVISDEVKEDAAQAVADLKALGVAKTVMLTGDAKAVGESVAAQLGLDEVHTQLLPADKVEQVEALLSEKTGKGCLAFVGDGINDAPVLSRADIGIAMGGLGSDAAIEAADVVLMDDKPSKIAVAIRIAQKTLVIVRQNIVFALGVKALVLVLGAVGEANLWEAVFADVGVSVIAILNAMRAMKGTGGR